MKLFHSIKVATSIITLVFGVLFSSQIAHAQDWVEIDPNNIWYNAEYTFVDRGTGLIVFEVAQIETDGSYSYFLDAVDCQSWYSYVLAMRDDAGNYDVVPYWNTDDTLSAPINPGSVINKIAVILCPDIYNLPSRNIIP